MTAMSSESEVNQSRTSVGHSQTGKQIFCVCVCEHTALYIVLMVKTNTHTPAHKQTCREVMATE